MKNRKEDQFLIPLEKVKKAMPDETFLKRMEEIADKQFSNLPIKVKRFVFPIAASLLILVSFNLLVLQKHFDNKTYPVSEDFISYDLIPTKTFYNE